MGTLLSYEATFGAGPRIRLTNPAEYRWEHQLGDEDPVPEVWFYYSANRKAFEQELAESQPCFLYTTSQYFLQQINVEEYFDRLLAHLRLNAVRHTFDKARLANLGEILHIDIIAGTIKSLMLNGNFPRLGETEAAQLKHLCLLAYRIDDPAKLVQGAADNGTTLDALPKRWLDLLAIIAYARRQPDTLKLLLSYPAPTPKSTFDLLTAWVIMLRKSAPDTVFEHSRPVGRAKLCEIQLWTTILSSPGKWIHLPMTRDDYGLYHGLQRLLWLEEEPQLREHPDVEKFCRAFNDIGIAVTPRTLSGLLSLRPIQQAENTRGIKPCSFRLATMILECFPISRIAASESKNGVGNKLRPGSAATILLPITQWPKNNRDRLAVMRMLLDQGCDPNDMISNNMWERQSMSEASRKLGDTPLHQAAERGDDQMVKLLLEFGAKRDVKSGWRGDTPAQRATAHQRLGTAARIERG
ncbi:hypothetical protein QBC47DRAFT_460398 [Echria macrotheca]|uniref:Ankyrin repeat protein n=1 Tax=Echria macrotheca TaxID=438768 RepID=A0AAJ0BIT9_9PEZI|nr:hypothetical protein QBC47DRAFT_460398 [Echria macrotheca]